MICSKCNTPNDSKNKFCKNCGTLLIPEQRIKSPIKQMKILGIDNRLVAVAFGILLLATIILGVISFNTNNQLTTAKNKLFTTQNQLVTVQNQLATTQNQLTSTQSQLSSAQSLR